MSEIEFLLGDIVITEKGQSAIINRLWDNEIHCIDFKSKKQMPGTFQSFQLTKATWNEAFNNSQSSRSK